MGFRVLLLAAAAFFGGTGSLWAHPHVWVEFQAEVTVAGGYVEGIWATWTFDEEFSQLILADNDPSGTGKISPSAVSEVKKGYFDNLKNYDYFSHVALGKQPVKIPAPQKFTAYVKDQGKVTYRFFLPLGVRLDSKTPLVISFYDDSYFTEMDFVKKEPVKLTLTDGSKALVTLKPDKSKTYYGGSVTPVFAYITLQP